MKDFKELLKSMRLGRNTFTLIIMLAIGAAMYFLLMYVIGPFQPMSRFPAAILMMVLAVSAWMYFDNVHFAAIDTINEIKQGNTAYAIVLLAIAILISAVIVSV